jgi:hypothetical protein
VVERVEEEEDPILIFTAQKCTKQPASLILITGANLNFSNIPWFDNSALST